MKNIDGAGEGIILIMRERVDLLETRVENAREEVMTAVAEGKALAGEITALGVRCVGVEDMVTEHVAALQALIDTERGTRLENAGHIKSLDETMAGNREGLVVCDRRIAQLETQHTEHLQAQEASQEREATMNKRVAALEATMNKHETVMNKRIVALEATLDKRIAALEATLDKRIAALEATSDKRIAALEASTDKRIVALEATMNKSITALEDALRGANEWARTNDARATDARETLRVSSQEARATIRSDFLEKVAALSQQISEGQRNLRAERNEIATGLVELLREESRSMAETFETQLLTLVSTMAQLKSSLEDRVRELWQQSKLADGERAQLSRGAVKASVALDGVDKRVESNKLAQVTSSRQSWEAARMSAATEARLRQLEREQSKLTGALAQHRESTLIALGRISEQLQ